MKFHLAMLLFRQKVIYKWLVPFGQLVFKRLGGQEELRLPLYDYNWNLGKYYFQSHLWL